MKFNTNLFAFTLTSIVLALALTLSVSAAGLGLNTLVQPVSVLHNGNSFTLTFNLTDDGSNTTVDFSTSTMTSGTATFSFPIVQINTGDNKTVTATVNFPTKHQSGNFAGTIKALHSNGTNATISFSVPINSTAAVALSTVQEFSLTQNASVKVSNEGNTPLNLALNASGSFAVSPSVSTVSLAAGTSQTVGLLATTALSSIGLKFGSYSASVTATDSINSISQTISVPFFKSYCSMGSVGGNLSLSSIDVTNTNGDDDKAWLALDNIEVDVDVDNLITEDIDDVVVELALFDSAGSDVSKSNLVFENSGGRKVQIGNLPDGELETVNFKFQVSPKLKKGKYQLAIKAYSKDLGESQMCDDSSNSFSKTYSEEITLKRETEDGKLINFDAIDLAQSELTCGTTGTLSVDVVNVGSTKQDQVRIELLNTELGISQNFVIRDDMSEGEIKQATFEFVIPANAQQKAYNLLLTARYDYDSVKDLYRQALDSTTDVPIKVVNCGASSTGQNFAISANLASTAAPGEDLVVVATIQNVQTSASDVVVGVKGYDSWATLSNSSSRILSVNAGESKQSTFTFKVNKNAFGEQSFIIETLSNGKTESREVSVDLGAKQSFFGSNWLVWVIVLVNVVLILLIIFVAIRLSRR